MQPLLDLVAVSGTRLLRAFDCAATGADVAPASEPAAREALLGLLRDDAELGGQFHAASSDPWWLLFTKGRRAVVPFQSRAFTLLGWRGPVGARSSHSEALRDFRDYASRCGKHAVILGASDRMRADGEQHSFGGTWVGSEQFFELARLSDRGRRGEKLRLAMNHAKRAGLRVRELFPVEDLSAARRIQHVEEAWKSDRPARRTKSFLRTAPLENSHYRRYFGVTEADGPDAPLVAFLVCSPVSARGYYLQDLVRHPRAPRGAGELVSWVALETFRRENVEFATMGIVPFYDPDNRRTREPLPPAAAWCVRRFDTAFRFSGLTQFRSKFPATRVEGIHALYWPTLLTPMVVWDIAQVVGR